MSGVKDFRTTNVQFNFSLNCKFGILNILQQWNKNLELRKQKRTITISCKLKL